MKIDHTSNTAVSRTDVRGGVTSVAHAARRCAVACLLAVTAVAVFSPVNAQDRGGFRKDDQAQQRDDRNDRNNNARQDAPRYDPRDQQRAADDARRQQQQQERAAEQRHSGRLTPDERRDLRRQINEAGVDLYPNTPRR
jgi:hypothetical protein